MSYEYVIIPTDGLSGLVSTLYPDIAWDLNEVARRVDKIYQDNMDILNLAHTFVLGQFVRVDSSAYQPISTPIEG